MKLLLAHVDRYAQTPEANVQLSELLAEDQEILARYLLEPRKPAAESPENAEEPAQEPVERADDGVQHNDY
jgi:hypothetical protein